MERKSNSICPYVPIYVLYIYIIILIWNSLIYHPPIGIVANQKIKQWKKQNASHGICPRVEDVRNLATWQPWQDTSSFWYDLGKYRVWVDLDISNLQCVGLVDGWFVTHHSVYFSPAVSSVPRCANRFKIYLFFVTKYMWTCKYMYINTYK